MAFVSPSQSCSSLTTNSSTSSSTPRRSPRLASKNSKALLTPVRNNLRKLAARREGLIGIVGPLQDQVKQLIEETPAYKSTLLAEVMRANVGNNMVRNFLVISKKLKSYDEQTGPYDASKVVVTEDGKYKFLAYHQNLQEGSISVPISSSSIVDSLDKLASSTWIVCEGIRQYSSYKASIGFDLERVLPQSSLPDSVRDRNCMMLFQRSDKSKATLCSKCSSLKWLLSTRKRTHDAMTPSQISERQSTSSNVPFDVLSPSSKKARIYNMRKSIKSLKFRASYYSEKVERFVSGDEVQNSDIGKLVESIVTSKMGREKLQEVYSEADAFHEGLGGVVKQVWEEDYSDWHQFNKDQETNTCGSKGNRWSSVTIRIALSIYSRSPAAYHALKSLSIFSLPSDKTLRSYMDHSNSPGINEEALLERAQKYSIFKQERVKNGYIQPVNEGVLIWDEVKVQSRIIWNSSNSSITGFSMSSDEFVSLHDVYAGLNDEEKCQKTSYMLQFLWRDLSSDFSVIGPYFNCSSSVEMHFLHSMVVRSMLAFSQFGFKVRALLCDGASSNLTLMKLFCGYTNDEHIDIQRPWFTSPFDGENVYLIVCPSHQLKNMVAALYSSRNEGTKMFKKGSAFFGWSSVESVYKSDLYRAQQGITRRVPGLKYAYVVRDSWTRLNVLPAKIMQQPYMIAAIQEMAEKRQSSSDTLTAEYLKACSLIFEYGILSHEKIESTSSVPLSNMAEGVKWFYQWKEELMQTQPDIRFRSPLQKEFLAWQTWDLLLIMHTGFTSLCKDFLARHPKHFIAPIRINGSAVESIFSCLKYISGGNLSSTNYASSISSLVTQRDITPRNPLAERGYKTDLQNIN